MLRQHLLDDERFAQIAESARLKAPEYFPAWNDLNTHDPGVTLIELFAWLTEMQRFHLGQSEDAAAFFPLLGIKPRRVKPAAVRILLPGGNEPRTIPAHTPLYAEEVRFEITEDICYTGSPLTLRAIQCETLRTPLSLGYADAFPGLRLTVDTRGQTILRERFSLTVDGKEWTLTDNFHISRPYDTHYALNDETGEILFGDGIHGAMPQGDVIVTAMAVTRGAGGNIAPNRITSLDGLPVLQPDAAEGGAARETVSEVITRARTGVRQAVTAQDIEQLVRETPGLPVERVRAYADENAPFAGAPRVVSIAVKLRGCAVTEAEKRRILAWLEPYRLVCRDYNIIEPETVRVGLLLELRTNPHGTGFRIELESSIRTYFAAHCGDFGAKLLLSEIRAFAAGMPEVLEVTYGAFRAYGGVRPDVNGNIFLPPGRLAELGEVSLRITETFV